MSPSLTSALLLKHWHQSLKSPNQLTTDYVCISLLTFFLKTLIQTLMQVLNIIIYDVHVLFSMTGIRAVKISDFFTARFL